MIEQKYIDVIEGLGWNILGDPNDACIELQQESPAGEDFVFGVDTADFLKEVIEYADDFDIDEHVELWVEHRGEGGCPSAVRELVEDAEAIKQMLKTLADALIDAQSDVPIEKSWLLGDDLIVDDNLLDGFSFYDVIIAAHCNCKTIDRNAIRAQVQEILSQRIEDMNYLLDRNIDKLVKIVKDGRN